MTQGLVTGCSAQSEAALEQKDMASLKGYTAQHARQGEVLQAVAEKATACSQTPTTRPSTEAAIPPGGGGLWGCLAGRSGWGMRGTLPHWGRWAAQAAPRPPRAALSPR